MYTHLIYIYIERICNRIWFYLRYPREILEPIHHEYEYPILYIIFIRILTKKNCTSIASKRIVLERKKGELENVDLQDTFGKRYRV